MKFGKMKVSEINTQFQEIPRGHEDQVREIVQAIRRGDKIPPILVSESGYLQDGRHRLEAYKRLNIGVIAVEYGHHPSAKVVKKRRMP
jgi:ParB-like chromosome segregation protein Spo0J